MEGISKEDLENILCSYDDSVTIAYITYKVLDACKELPDQQWQTIDEFKANPVDGWCHICYGHRNTDVAYHAQGKFMWCDASPDGDDYSDVDITHVVPIKTPEAPK